MGRGHQRIPHQGDLLDELELIEQEQAHLSTEVTGRDEEQANDRVHQRHSDLRAEVRSEEVRTDSGPPDLFSGLGTGEGGNDRSVGSSDSLRTSDRRATQGPAAVHGRTPAGATADTRDRPASGRLRPVSAGSGRDREASGESRGHGTSSTRLAGERFTLDASDEYAPSGAKSRFAANVAAIRVARTLQTEQRPATQSEQEVLAAWSSWGAVADVFDDSKANWASEREELKSLLSEKEYDQARRTILNAHYTSPAITSAIWDGLQQLGFTEGRVLEPGCGSGNFMGVAPDRVEMTGIELDPLTAAIAQGLYPDAEVRAESFSETRIRPGQFDAVIGNVPFGETQLYDPEWNPHRAFNLHDYFIRKSLGSLHEGGVMAVITSSGTMDKQNPALRREVAHEADLLGAVRLPARTHARTAGTDVTTDVLFFRKRAAGEELSEETRQWINTYPITVKSSTGESHQPRVNGYYLYHPERVLGDYSIGGRFQNLIVKTDDLDRVPTLFAQQVSDITQTARDHGRTYIPLDPDAERQRRERELNRTEEQPGTILARGDDFMRVAPDGVLVPHPVTKKHAPEVRALLELRDALYEVIVDQTANPHDTVESADLRQHAHDLWKSYVDKYGPVNRFEEKWVTVTVRDEETGRPAKDPETGETLKDRQMRRQKPRALQHIDKDNRISLVYAAEKFNDVTQEAQPADMLLRRTISFTRPLLGADTAEEALVLAINATGRADLDEVAKRYGADLKTTREALTGIVFDDPDTGEIVTRAEYLSGNVREKLEVAEAKREADPDGRWAENVTALREVIPQDVDITDIEAIVGAAWISTEIHEQFLKELVFDDDIEIIHPAAGQWDVRTDTSNGRRQSVEATSEWGTSDRPAHDIYNALLNKRQIVVRRNNVEDKEASEAARMKADLIQERFSEWVWEDPDRAAKLHEQYNRQFNCFVARDYSEEGQTLTFPGLSKDIIPHDHQRAAVARIVAEPSVGLFHQVGAGKTLAMVMGSMELKRRGLVKKPAVVVPNHMLEQFTREWQQAYPSAALLAAGTEDLKGDKRRQFVARAAANEWDGVVLTHNAFESLAVKPETAEAYTKAQVADLREALVHVQAEEDAGAQNRARTIKNIEQAISNFEARVESVRAKGDLAGLTFEETGIDYLCVDEAHMFKNLYTASRIQGAGIQGSMRASDLDMKLNYLRETYGERVVTMATGTPIANSIAEAHVMMRYLRPDLLDQQGIRHFDSWATTFGEVVTRFEPDAGGTLKARDRFAKFKNVPEILGLWQQFADVKLSDDLKFKTPPPVLVKDSDGERRPRNYVVPRSPQLAEYMDLLKDRLENVKPGGQDNHLTIYNDGRAAALDPRLVGMEVEGARVKVNVVADRIAELWDAYKDNEYIDPETGEVSPQRGAFQMVFCDQSTPKPDKWNVYDAIKTLLVQDHGMRADRIRFIHEAKNDQEKATLFRQARKGDIDVLIGSTEKMGAGTNIQDRAIALHHVDCPWRPADLTQREGRIQRQGNQNPEFHIERYATERSFDVNSWDTISRKATAIEQVMRGKIDVRELDDPGDTALDAQRMMASTTGDKLVVEKLELEHDIHRLERRQGGFRRQKHMAETKLLDARTELSFAQNAKPEVAALLEKSVDTRGDKFAARFTDSTYTDRSEAEGKLRSILTGGRGQWDFMVQDQTFANLVEVGGHSFDAYVAGGPRRMASLTFQINGTDLPFCQTKFKVQELLDSDKARMIPQLERLVRSLEDRPAKLEAAIEQHSKTIEQYEPQAKKTFEEKETLEAKKAALADVLKRIEGNQTVKAEAQTHETVAAAGTVAKGPGEKPMPHQTSESNGATRRLMSMNGAPRGQTHVHKPQDTPAHNWDTPTQKNHRGPER